MDAMRRIIILCRKELLTLLKDKRSRAVLIAPAILQTLVFGYAATYDLNTVPYAVLDQDRSAASHDLLAKIDGSNSFRRVYDLQNAHDIATAIYDRQALLVIHIGRNFQRQLETGAPAPVQLVLDGRNINTSGTAERYVSAVVDDFNTQWHATHGGGAPLLTLETRAWYNPNLETRWSMVPGLIAALSMLQTLLLTAFSVAREREQGTFDQLLVTPIRTVEIMAGKAVPSILIGMVQATVILLVALLWFRIPLAGSVFALYTGLLAFMVASVGIGLAISALAENMQQAMLYTFVLLMPMMLLAGLTTPIENMPQTVQYITLLDPLRYAVQLAQRVYLEGVGLRWVFADLWPLVVFGAVMLPMAAWLFRRRFA
jgi:ABC-2 type transport system permease protein